MRGTMQLPRVYDWAMWPLEHLLYDRRRHDVFGSLRGCVLEIGAGTGANLPAYNAAACITALEIEPSAAQTAQARAPHGHVRVVVGDGQQLPFADRSFDSVTVAFGLRNMADWGAALRQMARVVAPGGHVLVLDFSLPTGALRKPYRLYLHHFLPVIAGLVTGHAPAYTYLGDSIEKFPAGEAMLRLIEANGFEDARATPLTGGIATIYTARAAAAV